jgi:hypothetical protein
MPYIGNQPFGKTVRTVTTETITSVKTAYYPNGGYMAGYVDVYVNGVRLSESLDFTATDGSLVTLLYSPSIGDTVEIVTYGSVEIANAVRRSGDTFSGNVYVGSNVYISTSTISVGNATVNTQITAGNIALNGSTLTIGNSTVNTVFTGDTVTVGGTLSLGNTAITGTANVTTAINVGANVSMNTTTIRVGNSTVNTYIVSDTIYGPSTLYIDPAAAGDNTGLVVVKGDLQVDGTTFTINSANVTVNDKNVVLASGAINNAATDGAGLTIYGTNANLTYNATGNNFEMSRGLSITGTANVSVGLNVGANVNLSTSQINVGNSTVNTVITSASLSTNGVTITGGTANSVAYLNASKVVTTGSALTFDGTHFGVGGLYSGYGANYPTIQAKGTYGGIFRSSDAAGNTVSLFYSSSGNYLTLGTETNYPIQFIVNNSERMRLDTSGNLGLGVTPSAWSNGRVALDVKSNGAVYSGTNMVGLSGNAYDDGSWKRKAAAGATLYEASSNHAWYITGSSTAGSTITWTQAMTLDSSGNLGVGTTSLSAKLHVLGATSYAGLTIQALLSDSTAPATGTGAVLAFEGKYDGTAYANYAAIGGLKENATSGNYAGYLGFYTRANGSLPAERMRIDSSGNLLVATTSATATSSGGFTLGDSKTHIYGASSANSNSTAFSAQKTTLWIDNECGATNNEYAKSAFLISSYEGLSSNPGPMARFYRQVYPNAPARVFEVNNLGNIGLGDTNASTSGTGITFPATQSASTDANTLDDYEEGTWVVSVTPSASGSITLNTSINEMSYIKIGSMVTIFGRVLISSISSPSGSIRFNLPFAPETGLTDQSYFFALPIFTHDVNLNPGAVTLFGEGSGSSLVTVYQVLDNASWTVLPASDLKGTNGEYFYMTGSYRASA